MGYRSNVRIVMSKNGYEQFKKNVQEHINAYKNKLEPGVLARDFEYNLLNDVDISKLDDKIVYLGWNYLKWYDGYESVDAIMDSLDELEKQGYGYKYARIGMQYDDIEERYIDATEKDNIDYFQNLDIDRYFNDDNYLDNNLEVSEPQI